MNRTATVQKTLVWYDGPQLLILETDNGFPMLAVAVPEDGIDPPMDYPFFAAELHDGACGQYMRNEIDLRTALLSCGRIGWFLFDLSLGWNRVTLRDIAEPTKDQLPEEGFYARHH